jgi:hypothetical protein
LHQFMFTILLHISVRICIGGVAKRFLRSAEQAQGGPKPTPTSGAGISARPAVSSSSARFRRRAYEEPLSASVHNLLSTNQRSSTNKTMIPATPMAAQAHHGNCPPLAVTKEVC